MEYCHTNKKNDGIFVIQIKRNHSLVLAFFFNGETTCIIKYAYNLDLHGTENNVNVLLPCIKKEEVSFLICGLHFFTILFKHI